MKICVIGAGNWGMNHIKTLYDLNALGAVVDKNQKALDMISQKFSDCSLHITLDSNVIDQYDGFIVATEPSSHFDLAKK